MARKASEKESVVKVRSYGALMGALLTISSVEAADAATCEQVCKPVTATMRPAPARVRKADAEYAQSYYNYHSASRVTEQFVRGPAQSVARDDGFRVAPNDARIRFFYDQRAAYAPPAYPPSAYYAAPAYYPGPQSGVDIEQQGFNGGVGYGGMDGPDGGGGGGGGQAFLYLGQGGGSDVPPNGGGVNLPSGYGPTYRGVWQGPVNPTRGGYSNKR